MRYFAILMAAGFSKRFASQGNAKNKLLVPFRGKPLARHTLDLVCGMGCFTQIFFVYANEEIAALAKGLPVTLVQNPAPEKGHGESARLGVLAAGNAGRGSSAEPIYYVFFPCDQPLLNAAMVRRLLDAARPGFIAELGGGSPSLFSDIFRDELLSLKPGELPRLLKSRHPGFVIPIEAENPALLTDIDTSGDLERLEQLEIIAN